MSRVHRRGVIAGPKGQTYADFVAHITALATSGAYPWTNGALAGRYRSTASAVEQEMLGTSWMSHFYGANSQVSRVVQHGMPSQDAFNAQVSAGREIYYENVSAGGQSVFYGLDRNGYVSNSYSGVLAALYCIDLIYWDGTQAVRMNPRLGTGPTPYTW